jgi:hypothetical protein
VVWELCYGNAWQPTWQPKRRLVEN